MVKIIILDPDTGIHPRIYSRVALLIVIVVDMGFAKAYAGKAGIAVEKIIVMKGHALHTILITVIARAYQDTFVMIMEMAPRTVINEDSFFISSMPS